MWTAIILSSLAMLCVGLVAQYGMSMSLGGVSIQKSINRTGDHANAYEVTLPVAYAVTSWVKTDANTAACNLPSSHGQTNGKYDVFWTGGMRYGVDGTIATNALSLDGGTGTDFPASADTTVVVCKQVSIATAVDGDAISILALSLEYVDPNSAAVGHIDMQDSGAATIEEIDLAANAPQVWDITGGATNIFSGNVITVSKASHNNTSAAATLKLLSLEDSTA
ncbi:MAG: hypothetical protein IAF94_26015 [Pirellulaceae bacterium]|nr:hypothetical protein [Pirellulaceae bacterium]